VNEVAAPLFRFFLTDAQTAAREGDRDRMHECLEMALDFVPEGQRERVLLAASELLPAPAGRVPASPASQRPVVVKVAAAPAARPAVRIAWENQIPPAPAFAPAGPPAELVPARAGTRRWLAFAAAALLAAAGLAGAAASGAIPGIGLPVAAGDATARAAGALRDGDAARALDVLAPFGAGAPAAVWLLRGEAHVLLDDTASAVEALMSAASRDSDGGRVALQAGAALARMGAVQEAADASLYAVTPERSLEELERVAVLQERAGHPERARRVRQR
jgi:hypothetical protein